MANKPYKEGKTWSYRIRIKGEDIHGHSFATEAAARKESDKLSHTLKSAGKPALNGPWRTTLAQALRDFAFAQLPGLKAAKQDACRINRYLRLAGLATLRVVPVNAGAKKPQGGVLLWQVEEVARRERQIIPRGLSEHREKQAKRSDCSDKQRKKLARMYVADIHPHDIQVLLDFMKEEGYGAATIGLERAMLRRLFSYAKQSWSWPEPARNPAQGLSMLTLPTGRERVLTNKEWQALKKALETCSNAYVAPALELLLETAMRSSEALVGITWGDFDPEQHILHLRAAKAGGRDVPLGPGAMRVLSRLQALARSRGEDCLLPTARILPLSYEALKAWWYRLCERAGIKGVKLHDLRHTSATRYAMENHGNVPLMKVITGHKTVKQLLRYIHFKASDVALMLHGQQLNHDNAPACMQEFRVEAVRPLAGAPAVSVQDLPANVLPMVRRARPG
jgi:integrase